LKQIAQRFPWQHFGKKFNRTPFEQFFIAKHFQRVSSTNLNSPKVLVVYMEDIKSSMASYEIFDVQE